MIRTSLAVVLLAFSSARAEFDCRETVDSRVKVALTKEEVPKEAMKELQALVERDPELQKFLLDENFVRFLEAVAANKSIEELRPFVSEIWKNSELNDTSMGSKTGFLLIGPTAANQSRLLNVINKLQTDKNQKSSAESMSKKGFLAKRIVDQIKGFGTAIRRSKQLIETEMHPTALDSSLFDFYGYLNHKFLFSQLREWKTPENSMAGVKLSDIEGTDPLSFIKGLMLASQVESPVHEYSDASGHIFNLYPQAARFMGKTEEQAAYHRKMRDKNYCTNSWCVEENRHEGLLENLARRLVGIVLPNNRPFTSDKTLSPFKPEDVMFHVTARANNELAASTTYFWLGSHARGNTEIYLENIRKDELKHSTIFTGLYEYLNGNTYLTRLKGVIKKTLIEIADKKTNSPYADVLTTEPVVIIEIAYAQFKYEAQIRRYLNLLPLKTLRKFFETEINLPELPSEKIEQSKADRIARLSAIEAARRKALAGWPKAQREAAYALEYFESEYSTQLLRIVTQRLSSFKAAEDFGSMAHDIYMSRIQSITMDEALSLGISNINKDKLNLLKKSLADTLRDYQIMNNRVVREKGLSVEIKDIQVGFEIVKDEKYHAQEKVAGAKPIVDASVASVNVLSITKTTNSTAMIRIQKPVGFVAKPGEAISLAIKTKQGLLNRDLSIANDPAQNYLEIAVRISDSYFKEAFEALKVGSQVGLSQPKGNLRYKKDVPSVFIAGGIGITPFRGILQSVAYDKTIAPSLLLYANRSASDIPFKSEIESMVKGNPKISVRHFISEKSQVELEDGMTAGRIDKANLSEVVNSMPADTIFYIVGTPQMVVAMKMALTELGVPKEQLAVETFRGY